MRLTIAFITGNKGKVEEAKHRIPDLVHLKLDLPEIQSLDSKEIIAAKLHEARKRHDGPLMVEDTSLELAGLNGFPGPLIKWLLGSVGVEGIWRLCSSTGNTRARGVCTIGYAHGDKIEFFTGAMDGTIVEPRESQRAFGWDRIFLPDGETRTYSQLSIEEKNRISHRVKALAQLVSYLKE